MLDWEKDTLADILKKMDFNAEKMGTAVARLSGMLVCFADALSKCASLVMVNPGLNDLAIKTMAVGGALAVSPKAISKIASKLGLL